MAPLTPARAFFANIEASGDFQISPDGLQLAWIAAHGTGPALWVRALDGGVARVVAHGIVGFRWAQDSRHVLFGRDQGGNENYHVMRVDTQAEQPVPFDLTPHANTRAHVHRMLRDDPLHILVLHNQRDKRHFDLYRVHLLSGVQTLVAQNPGDVVDVATNRAGQVVGLVYQRGDERVLHAAAPGQAPMREVLRWGQDEAVSVLGLDAQAQGFYLLSNRARDGLALHGYLTLPPGQARPPGPLVLLVHGGPWARDHWDNGLGTVQFLVNRGYAVLQVNYRGSTGYGRRFTQAAVGEFAARMQDDLHDAVAWAVAQGVADPQKIAIMGASYGGYAALVGLSFTPQAFACGVDMVGVSNLASLVEKFPPYWESSLSLWHRFVGNPAIAEQRQVMLDKSPISRASAIVRPLLVIQTGNDVRVRQEQSDQLVQALRNRDVPVQYLLMDNAGHSFNSWSWGKKLRAHRAVEDFLASCLGGRSAGMDLYELAAWLF